MLKRIKEVAKLIVALIGSLATAGTTLIPEAWAPWLALALALATAVVTWATPNAPSPELRAQISADAERAQQQILGSK